MTRTPGPGTSLPSRSVTNVGRPPSAPPNSTGRKGGAFQFWNVLSDLYFTGELITGSLRVPVDFVGREAAKLGLPKDAEIIVYCKDTECPASARAAEKLQTLGYTNVRAYEGGLKAWKAEGHPVVALLNSAAA